MPKAIIEYDLNDFDDNMAHLRAVKSSDMASAIWQILYNTKRHIESEIEENNLNGHDTLDRVYEKIAEIIDEQGIKIDELIV